MPNPFNERLKRLQADRLADTLGGIRRGLEKESLRVTHDGLLAQTPHPIALGSALTHPYITTDFSEALLEFITPPCHRPAAALEFMDEVHRYVCSHLGDELLWAASMPCILHGDESIPVARYGSSNVGQMKTIYRVGLGHRYGRLMQTISGIHYNFSLPDDFWEGYRAAERAADASLRDFKTTSYFSLIRNFRRYAWLLLYLLGASPAVCRTFLGDRPHRLEPLDGGTLHAPWGTSLRMGDLGYQASAQEDLIVSYNSLDRYISSLHNALTRPHAAYEAIGLRGDDGSWRQLSTHLLQIENEFYSTVRPKRTTRSGETPIRALADRGVEYVEIRALDVNPYLPLGIDDATIAFVDAFLMFCLLWESLPLSDDDYREAQFNLATVVNRGREPGLKLRRDGRDVTRDDWASSLLGRIGEVAALMDSATDTSRFVTAVLAQRDLVADPEATPSARILQELRDGPSSWFEFAMEHSRAHHRDFLARALSDERHAWFAHQAEQSLAAQHEVEVGDSVGFEQYLREYYRQYQLPDAVRSA